MEFSAIRRAFQRRMAPLSMLWKLENGYVDQQQLPDRFELPHSAEKYKHIRTLRRALDLHFKKSPGGIASYKQLYMAYVVQCVMEAEITPYPDIKMMTPLVKELPCERIRTEIHGYSLHFNYALGYSAERTVWTAYHLWEDSVTHAKEADKAPTQIADSLSALAEQERLRARLVYTFAIQRMTDTEFAKLKEWMDDAYTPYTT